MVGLDAIPDCSGRHWRKDFAGGEQSLLIPEPSEWSALSVGNTCGDSQEGFSLDICSGLIMLGGNIPAERWPSSQAERGESSSHGIKGEKSGKDQSRAGLAAVLLLLCFMALPSCRCQELPRPDQSSVLPSKSGGLKSLLPSREGELWVCRGSS